MKLLYIEFIDEHTVKVKYQYGGMVFIGELPSGKDHIDKITKIIEEWNDGYQDYLSGMGDW